MPRSTRFGRIQTVQPTAVPKQRYSQVEARLLDALFALVASSAALVTREAVGLRQRSTGLAQPLEARLDRVISGLKALSLLARVLVNQPWQQERSSIRGGRSANIGPGYTKRIPVIADGEQPASDQSRPKEVHVSDVLLFPTQEPEGLTEASLSSPGWPRISDLRLNAKRLDARNRGIGGSDANIILSGDGERIVRLWQEKRGEAEPEDLSGKLSVVLGSWTEELNRQWYQALSGNRVVEPGKMLTCGTYRWRKCTLDGVVERTGAVFEAKHTNAFVKTGEVLERYMPQLQHNMAVSGADRAILSVIFGNAKYEMFEVATDWLYQLDLLNAEKAFWNAVLSGEPPVALSPPPVPRPVATRELRLDGNNAWASAAVDWLENDKAAKTHAAACKTIKALIDDDVARAFGHGIEARRSKSGAISIRELT